VLIFKRAYACRHAKLRYSQLATQQLTHNHHTMTKSLLAPLLLLIAGCHSTAFIQPSSSRWHKSSSALNPTTSISWRSSSQKIISHQQPFIHHPIIRSNQSTQLQSLFGLGPAELAIIGIAAIFLIGPSKLGEFTRSAGEVAGKEAAAWKELKNIPEEFQKGLEEGEIEGRSRKAKVMDKVDVEKNK
jgi:sec-independent protein translocase protein TatA